MKVPILPALLLLAVAVALYLLPDGVFHSWRLFLHGGIARLYKAEEGSDSSERLDYPLDRELLDRLLQKDAELASLHQQLRDLGVTRQAITGMKITQARIIGLGPNNQPDAFVIDVGSEDGILTGDAVVVGQAVAGVVARTGERASLVLSLSSPGCYISVRLGPAEATNLPREMCAVQGAGHGGVKVVLFSTGSAASPGWQALTSGLEKGIPEGLLVGAVAGNFVEGVEAGTLEAELKPHADLSALDYVAVLTRDRDEKMAVEKAAGTDR